MGAGPLAPEAGQRAALFDAASAACAEAAVRIAEADVLLLCTGAGFSADSGLATYADIAKVRAYADRGMDYETICQPKWLNAEPELFWGFWGQCHNDYRSTAPHEGYEIVERWAAERFRASSLAEEVRRALEDVPSLQEGMAVEVIRPFRTNSRYSVKLKEGTRGRVKDVDKWGDVLISFDGVLTGQWVCKRNLRKLSSVEDDIDDRFGRSLEAKCQLDTPKAKEGEESHPTVLRGMCTEPYKVSDQPGAFFVFTSNVDAHHFDYFYAPEIRECHGNTELYQCAGIQNSGGDRTDVCPGVWRAPLDFTFRVDAETLLAPKGPAIAAEFPAQLCRDDVMLGFDGGEEPARVGRVRCGGRDRVLLHMPAFTAEEGCEAALTAETIREAFTENHPRCPKCGGPARPAILMFYDSAWQDVFSQKERWQEWSTAVKRLAKARAQRSLELRPLRAVVLEIGAGGNVTTVRNTAEDTVLKWREAGADARLFRVNPDLPLGDDERLRPDGLQADAIVSILGTGLESLRRIDVAMPGSMRGGKDQGRATQAD